MNTCDTDNILDKIDVLGRCLSVMNYTMKFEKYNALKAELEDAYRNNKITQADFTSAYNRLNLYVCEKQVNNY